jgi:hypothetical protein
MVDLKQYNYFTGEISEVASGVSQIVDFFDLAGRNYVLFSPPKPSSSSKYHDLCLYHYLQNKIIFDSFEDFSEKINNNSNLFRVDLLVFDFWSIDKNNLWKYTGEIDKFGTESIIVAREFHYKTGDNVNDFKIRKEYKDLKTNQIWLIDNILETSTTLNSLKLSYIRHKKLEHIFKDNTI